MSRKKEKEKEEKKGTMGGQLLVREAGDGK